LEHKELKDDFTFKIVNFVVRLTILCSLAGLLLSWVYKKTKPIIEEQRAIAINLARKEVLPDAVNFEKGDKSYLTGYSESGEIAGKIAQGSRRGYGGPVKVMVGVDSEGEIIGVKILEHYETPGLGDGIAKTSFLKQFYHRDENEINLARDRGKIEAVTGATISSKACVLAAREALNLVGEKPGE
jgi:electron transport complex protein RnfG